MRVIKDSKILPRFFTGQLIRKWNYFLDLQTQMINKNCQVGTVCEENEGERIKSSLLDISSLNDYQSPCRGVH